MKNNDDNEKTVKRRPFASNGRVQSNSGDGYTTYYDASDFYATEYHNYIQFTSIIGGANATSVKFKAFLTAFDDQFKSDWNSEQVYGRSDPIQTFKNTTRSISIGWDCPAGSIWEAKQNMANASLLVRMLYPGYRSIRNVSTIDKPPLIKVKFRNLIKDNLGVNGPLLVTLDGISFSPDLEAGFFDADESKEFAEIAVDELIPKLLKFSCTMTVLHKKTIGFTGSGRWPSSGRSNLGAFPNLPKTIAEEIKSKSGVADKRVGEAAFIFGNGETQGQTPFNKEEEAAQAALEAAQEELDIETSEQQTAKEERKANKQARKAKRASDKVNRGRAPLPPDDLDVENADPGTYAPIEGLPRFPGEYEDLGE